MKMFLYATSGVSVSDHTNNLDPQMVNIIYDTTDANIPSASVVPEGTIFIKYTT